MAVHHSSTPGAVVEFLTSRRSLLAGVSFWLFVAGCLFPARRIVTSEPWGAQILEGPTPNNMRPSGETTPMGFASRMGLEAYCYQATKSGYSETEIRCVPPVAAGEEQRVFFQLENGHGEASSAEAHSDGESSGALPKLITSPLVRPGQVPRPRTVFVTAGSVSRPFEVLGTVHINSRGIVALGSILSDHLFRSRLERAVGGATPDFSPEEAYEQLKSEAISQYGDRVDAVVNATYRAEHDGDVFAEGLAVRFTEGVGVTPSNAPIRSVEHRLTELQGLFSKGLLGKEEYERKRAEILKEL